MTTGPDPVLAAVRRGGPAARSRAALYVAAVVFVLMAFRQQAFVQRYAVDVLYWDSWDLYEPLFRHQGWWASFDQQHGPHRQGLGGLWIRFAAPRTGWNCQWDAAAVSVSLMLAVPPGVWLAWRCGVRGWTLAAVPVAYLNTRQYQMFVALANPSHGTLPVLLLTAYCLAWFTRRTGRRLCLVVGLTFLLVFTGFGVFAGVLTPALLGVELAQAIRRDRRRAVAVAVALAGTAAVWAAFAHGYRFDPASAKFRFPVQHPAEYLLFIAALSANYAGVGVDTVGTAGPGTIALGVTVAVAAVAVCGIRATRLVRHGVTVDRPSVAIFCLSAFGLLYAVDAAVGRTPEGWRIAASSRYVTLCIPTGLAVLFHLATSGPTGRRLAVGLGGLLAVGTAVWHPGDEASAQWARDGCLRWRAAYLVTHDQELADRLARFLIYPRPELGPRLEYLEANHLNLFDPGVYGTPAADVPPPVRPPGTGGR